MPTISSPLVPMAVGRSWTGNPTPAGREQQAIKALIDSGETRNEDESMTDPDLKNLSNIYEKRN